MHRLRALFARNHTPTYSEDLILPASVHLGVIRAEFDQQLVPLGFAQATGLKWTRPESGGMRAIVDVYALKSRSRVPRWGVALDFVPDISGTSIAWHRTAKAARIDLGYHPLDYEPWFRGWDISPFDGLTEARNQASAVARRVADDATAWLAPISDLTSLIAAFEREAAREAVRFPVDAGAP